MCAYVCGFNEIGGEPSVNASNIAEIAIACITHPLLSTSKEMATKRTPNAEADLTGEATPAPGPQQGFTTCTQRKPYTRTNLTTTSTHTGGQAQSSKSAMEPARYILYQTSTRNQSWTYIPDTKFPTFHTSACSQDQNHANL